MEVFVILDGLRRMVDVIGRLGWSLSINIILGVFLLSLSSCLHTVCNNLFTSNIYCLLIQCVCFTSSTVCPSLSMCIPPCKFLSFSPRHTDMGLFAWISHFLFGVCIRSLVLVPSTHQTLTLLKMRKRDRKEDTQKVYKWGNDGKSRCEWERGMCGEIRMNMWGPSGHIRTVEGKILTDDTDTVKTKGKWKRSRKYKVVNYHNIHRYGQMMPYSCQMLRSYCKIVFHPNLLSKESGLLSFPITICFYLL